MKELTYRNFLISLFIMTLIFHVEIASLSRFNTAMWAQFLILGLGITKTSGLWYYRNKNIQPVTSLRKIISLYTFCVNTIILIFIITLTPSLSTFFLKISYIIMYSLTIQLIYFKELGVSNT